MKQRDRQRMIWALIKCYDYELDNGSYKDWKNGLNPSQLAKQEVAERVVFEKLQNLSGRNITVSAGKAQWMNKGDEICDQVLFHSGDF
jgi:hypothetical protein|tara:strand:+ start:830 stop:1093 length:264 start_codon:yes stop_codon:yes gene_type:complete